MTGSRPGLRRMQRGRRRSERAAVRWAVAQAGATIFLRKICASLDGSWSVVLRCCGVIRAAASAKTKIFRRKIVAFGDAGHPIAARAGMCRTTVDRFDLLRRPRV